MAGAKRARAGRGAIDIVEIAWIPLRDGRRLAARLFLPKGAAKQPVPAILEYIPYRRRDGTRARDDETHVWFAANGYGCARVDIAGSGDSDGLIEDEYVKREQDDALEIIAWLADQAWCSGSVGMIGISWGGFNGLQVAARRPKALKAVIALCATVDRYHDDVHFMGGCLLNDNLDWGAAFFTYGALPPDPAMAGARRWRKVWRERLEGLELYPARWLAHQRRDGFWRHGSVIETYDAIQCPVLAVSGWADGYTAAVFRLVENLQGPVKGIVGPWGHKYPHRGVPGPAIGFLQECKRWWDRWLKGIETGVEADPALRLYLQDSAPPAAHHDQRPGRWLGLPDWPAKRTKRLRYHFSGERLVRTKPKAKSPPQTISSAQTTGLGGGEWCAYALGKTAPELPLDQRGDDAESLLFETAPLPEPLTIVGRPLVRLRVAADKRQAFVALRLNDVRPDGTVARITYGLLNLSHRESHAKPTALTPGRFYDVTVALNEIAQRVPAGHRLRLAVSTSYWPMVWPSPEAATVTLDPAASSLELPLLQETAPLRAVDFAPVAHAAPLRTTVLAPGGETRQVVHDIESQRTDFVVRRDDGRIRIDDIGTEVAYRKEKTFSLTAEDPLSARSRIGCRVHYRRGDWDARIETDCEMTADKTHFHLTATLRAYDRGRRFAERHFAQSIRRDHL